MTTPTPVTLVNMLSVEPEQQQQLVELLRQNTAEVITTLKGWIATDLIASVDGKQVIIYSRWETPADVDAMRKDPRMVAYFPRIAALATLTSVVGTTVACHQR